MLRILLSVLGVWLYCLDELIRIACLVISTDHE